MCKTGKDKGVVPSVEGEVELAKIVALQAIRQQMGSQITSGAELLQGQQTKEPRWPSGLEHWDEWLGGGLARGQLTEVISPAISSGSGLILAALLGRARQERRYVMLLDVGRGFSLESVPEQDLDSLLWVGCASAEEAIEALDVASRDENFHLFLIDLRDCDPGDWRSVRANQWYRVLGQLRQRESIGVIFARHPVTTVAKQRMELVGRLPFECLERERSSVLPELRFRRDSLVPTEREGRRRRVESLQVG